MNTEEMQAKAGELKKKHSLSRVVALVVVPERNGVAVPDETKVAYLKPLTRIVVKAALNFRNPADIGETILLQCWLEGAEEIKDDVDYWYPAVTRAYELLPTAATELKNF